MCIIWTWLKAKMDQKMDLRMDRLNFNEKLYLTIVDLFCTYRRDNIMKITYINCLKLHNMKATNDIILLKTSLCFDLATVTCTLSTSIEFPTTMLLSIYVSRCEQLTVRKTDQCYKWMLKVQWNIEQQTDNMLMIMWYVYCMPRIK